MPDPLLAVDALTPVWEGRRVLRLGASPKEATLAVQRALVALFHPLQVDGDLGPSTARAIKVAQAARGRVPDGAVGRQTLEDLDAALRAPPLQVLPPMPGRDWAPRGAEPVAGLYRQERYPGFLALSFDDGPHPSRTDAVLAVLEAAGVRATFYVLGQRVPAAPEVLRRVARAGHRLGQHSWDHPNFSERSDAQIQEELRRCEQVIRDTLGALPEPLLRPPYGAPFHSDQGAAAADQPRVGRVLREAGRTLSMWQVDSWDWKYPGQPEQAVRRLAGELDRAGGGVALFHDINTQSAQALPGVFDLARQRQLKLCDEQTLLALKYGGGGRNA